jgi:hypothetical protein
MGRASLNEPDPIPLAERDDVGSSRRDLAKLQSRIDQAYRLSWVAGDDVTRERLRSYARELEASIMPPVGQLGNDRAGGQATVRTASDVTALVVRVGRVETALKRMMAQNAGAVASGRGEGGALPGR